MDRRGHAMGMAALMLALLCASCHPTTQDPNQRTDSAYEIPLPTDADKASFVDILRTEGRPFGYHVDVETKAELRDAYEIGHLTMNLAVWRSEDEDEVIASALDGLDHPGRVWIVFTKGSNPVRSRAFRDHVVSRLQRQWKQVLRLPIMPTGAIPNPSSLIRTANGYEVNPRDRHYYLQAGG